jgi:hypothetical protein
MRIAMMADHKKKTLSIKRRESNCSCNAATVMFRTLLMPEKRNGSISRFSSVIRLPDIVNERSEKLNIIRRPSQSPHSGSTHRDHYHAGVDSNISF